MSCTVSLGDWSTLVYVRPIPHTVHRAAAVNTHKCTKCVLIHWKQSLTNALFSAVWVTFAETYSARLCLEIHPPLIKMNYKLYCSPVVKLSWPWLRQSTLLAVFSGLVVNKENTGHSQPYPWKKASWMIASSHQWDTMTQLKTCFIHTVCCICR